MDMTPPIFTPADLAVHRDALIDINIEYVTWVTHQIERLFGLTVRDLLGMPVTEYVPSVIDKVCGDQPPRGVFYLIHVGDELAGICGLRHLRDGVAEVKRLYIRPAFRGQHLGRAALLRVLSDAKAFEYQSICLDSGPFMGAAQRLYETFGFVDCPAYEGVEVPPMLHSAWRFMERDV